MARWVTGITLKRYFGFTEHQMRKLRKEVGRESSKDPMNPRWLYDLDKVLANHEPKTAIPDTGYIRINVARLIDWDAIISGRFCSFDCAIKYLQEAQEKKRKEREDYKNSEGT